MPEIWIWSAVFIASLAVLIKSSDFFVDASEKIGLALGLSPFVIGVTLVAVGTSLPELVSSVISVTEGASEFVAGNVVGSNITNICLIFAIVAVVSKKFNVEFDIMRVDTPFLAGSAFLLLLLCMDGSFDRFDGLISLLGMAVYLLYLSKADNPLLGDVEEHERPEKFPVLQVLIVVASAVGIYFGAKYTVESVIKLSEIAGIPNEIIALTAVALGTSLPELIVSIVAIRKSNAEMVVGNILGSNIFNTFAVMGVPAMIGTLVIPASVLAFSLPLMLAITLLFLFIVQDKEINRWEGLLLLLFYVVFIVKVLMDFI